MSKNPSLIKDDVASSRLAHRYFCCVLCGFPWSLCVSARPKQLFLFRFFSLFSSISRSILRVASSTMLRYAHNIILLQLLNDSRNWHHFWHFGFESSFRSMIDRLLMISLLETAHQRSISQSLELFSLHSPRKLKVECQVGQRTVTITIMTGSWITSNAFHSRNKS